jgi:F0F1-type ATP synthase membrane subunit b/b'
MIGVQRKYAQTTIGETMESRADRIKTLLNQRAAIDEELDQIRAEVTAERDALKALRKSRKPNKPHQPPLAVVGETQ